MPAEKLYTYHENATLNMYADRTMIKSRQMRILLASTCAELLQQMPDHDTVLFLSISLLDRRGSMELMENVHVSYNTATGRIAVKGKKTKIVLHITQEELMKAYSGDEGKGSLIITIKEDLNDGLNND